MQMLLRPLCVVASAVVAAAAVSSAAAYEGPGGKVSIADLTPTDAFVVLSVEDWTKARAAFNNSIYGKLWQDQPVKDFVWEFMRAESKSDKAGPEWLASELKEVGIDSDDLHEPSGPAGAAMYFEQAPPEGWPAKATDAHKDKAPDIRPRMQLVAIAEFGDNAEAMDGVVEKLAEDLKRKGLATLDEEQHEGQTIRVLTRVENPDREAGHGDDEDEFDVDDRGGPWSSAGMDQVRVAKVGTSLVATTSKSAMHRAIDRLAGRAGRAEDTLGESKAYQSALAQHPRDVHGSLVLLAGPTLRGAMREGMAGVGAMTGVPMKPEAILDALGLGSVDAVSLGMRLENDTGAAEQTLGVLTSEKKGLLTMVDAPAVGGGAGFEAPPFAAADCASLTTLSVRFDRLIGVVRGVIQALPEEMLPPNAAKAAEDALTPFVNALGSEVAIVSTYRRPLSQESSRTIVAIKLKDALGLANLVTGFAAQIGAELRDFQGNQIFEMPRSPASVGIGAGYAYIGQVEDIENAMRLASDPSLPSLGNGERFKAASAAAGAGGAVYGFTNIGETLAYTYWEMENAEKLLEAELNDLELEPEEKNEAMEHFRKNQPTWIAKLPPVSSFTRHMGDTVFELHSTPDGFRGRWLLLKPARE